MLGKDIGDVAGGGGGAFLLLLLRIAGAIDLHIHLESMPNPLMRFECRDSIVCRLAWLRAWLHTGKGLIQRIGKWKNEKRWKTCSGCGTQQHRLKGSERSEGRIGREGGEAVRRAAAEETEVRAQMEAEVYDLGNLRTKFQTSSVGLLQVEEH